jgi:insertion element IS1 protein InsB
LGEKGGVWQGLESDARRKSGMGGGGRAMDLCLEKKDDCWLWWAIDRASKRVLGWALGDRGTETAERLDAQLPHAPHIVFATDFWHPYGKIFSKENHVQGKAHTFTIESLNNRIRCYLARLKRKTHNYSKSQVNLAASILFFIVKKCGGELVSELKPIPI